MGSSPSTNRSKATSTQPRGGCFSAVFSQLMLLAALAFIYQLLVGETTRPWNLNAEASTGGQSGQIAGFFAPSVLFWEQDILRWADEWELDPNLVATVMQIESCGDPRALSHAGAMGLFQVMPYHFETTDAPYHPNTNAKRGMAYLSEALSTYNNNIRLALASYNGGIGTAAKAEMYWPNETVRYVYWGTGIYEEAARGYQSSARLEEWLAAGGASLCQQANERLGIRP